MYQIKSNFDGSQDFYTQLEKELVSLVTGEKNLVANLANLSSWVYHAYPDLNWCGFYLWSEQDHELVLGPFQGRPACIRIKAGRGVCGTAFNENKTIRVENVDDYPGHIACDSASKSELVVPLIKEGKTYGVLDLDSPFIGRFDHLAETEFTRIFSDLSTRIF
ncbi:MAG TPA: GAF domain-containing protein [Bacteriovoracaceae bacterium]|nr:GAF domain-containing protein [Bacteriovoracaceae bacterium]